MRRDEESKEKKNKKIKNKSQESKKKWSCSAEERYGSWGTRQGPGVLALVGQTRVRESGRSLVIKHVTTSDDPM